MSPATASSVPLTLGSDTPVDLNVLETVPVIDQLLQEQNRGIENPYRREVELSRTISAGSPTGCNPIEVARYFLNIRSGYFDDQFGAEASSYCEEWPVRANPLIIGFFDSTSLRKPAGDQTAWCAAFVNWCIDRARNSRSDKAGLLASTGSAASSTFRTWGRETEKPVIGDIAVFIHSDGARGHVGFFGGSDSAGVYVLGGNQMPMKAKLAGGTYERRNTGEVNMKWFPFRGKDLKLHSIRTDKSLHDL